MLKKNEIPVTPFSKTIIHYGESDKDRYIQTLSFHELKQIKNVHGTDIEQRKELKKTKPVLTKNLTLQQKD
jgi:hypothetical protein